MSDAARRRIALFAVIAITAGCGRCSRSRDTGAPPPPLLPRDPLPPPHAWTFEPAREPVLGVALPERCSFRAPPVRATIARATRFVAEPRAIGALVVADARGDPPQLTGAAAVTLDAAGASRDAKPIPWFIAGAPPRVARAPDGRWFAAFERPGSGKRTRVAVWRDTAVESVGEGDELEPVDLACSADRCILLTTRLGGERGASAWIGRPDRPASEWRRVDVDARAPRAEARPVSIASTEGNGVVAMLDAADLGFFRLDGGAPHAFARLSAPNDVIDAAAIPTPVALVFGSAIGDDGCARGGPALRIERAGAAGIDVTAPAPPLAAWLRKLRNGALATWLAPLGCGAERRVLYGVVLDGAGAPVGTPVPIADATTYAVASNGDAADIWMQNGDRVTWLELSCAP